VIHGERRLEAADGTQLQLETWSPEGTPRFAIAIAHGGADHVGRFAELASHFADRGGFAFGADHRGQGSSGGTRGHVERFEDYASDLRHVLLDVRAGLPDGLPLFLFGHSMGGLIALVYLLDRERDVPLRGAILSAPLLGLTMKVNPVKLAFGKVAGLLLPTLALPSGIPPDQLTHDPDVVRRYVEDTRRTDKVTTGWFAAMNHAIARADREVGRIALPMLWYHGTQDGVCDVHATERVFATLPDAPARDQTLRIMDGYRHELHNEPGEMKAKVHAMLDAWIDARCG
jgi:alpha-beta hydrolase superfamily lysophospholipase